MSGTPIFYRIRPGTWFASQCVGVTSTRLRVRRNGSARRWLNVRAIVAGFGRRAGKHFDREAIMKRHLIFTALVTTALTATAVAGEKIRILNGQSQATGKVTTAIDRGTTPVTTVSRRGRAMRRRGYGYRGYGGYYGYRPYYGGYGYGNYYYTRPYYGRSFYGPGGYGWYGAWPGYPGFGIGIY
jgi:hypothetical protein